MSESECTLKLHFKKEFIFFPKFAGKYRSEVVFSMVYTDLKKNHCNRYPKNYWKLLNKGDRLSDLTCWTMQMMTSYRGTWESMFSTLPLYAYFSSNVFLIKVTDVNAIGALFFFFFFKGSNPMLVLKINLKFEFLRFFALWTKNTI